ncbi:ABC transporter permease [Agrococcus baldri]|uniref:Autoinducer 2 import system permease protein LsrD n=1 Tax=Agrococcus baldri TaxID=153730 RepID=A0AA87UR01_9MICO|nr:ABC transporter permease [Agrococcus baldri]GEK79228.1 sugar ABC transporter permease [Agrococcus baldri]
MTAVKPQDRQQAAPQRAGVGERMRDWVAAGGLKDRTVLLLVLIVVLVVAMTILDAVGVTRAEFNSDYLASSLIAYVPLALLGIAQLFVITSGRGGIDLSVGSMVSLAGIVFAMLFQQTGLPMVVSIVLAVLFGALLGAFNGFLSAYLGFPPLITTLATFYGYRSIALVVSDQKPISGPEISEFYNAAKAIELPLIGQTLPLVPLGVFTFLLPVAVLAWFVLNRTAYGRSLYAIGTNDTAAQWAGIDTRRTRMTAFVTAGAISGFVGVYTVAQFASARPDAGTSGGGMALPAITIAVLGGVAITGGIGRLSGVLLAALLIVWLNASILIVVPGNDGAQAQLLALGLVLLGAALFGQLSLRRRRAAGAPTTVVPVVRSP